MKKEHKNIISLNTSVIRRWWVLPILITLLILEFFLFKKNYLYASLFNLGIAFVGVALLNVKYLWYIGIILMPLSQNFDEFGASFSLTLPSDIVAIALWLVMIFKTLGDIKIYQKIFKHPIIITFTLYLTWMLVCTIFSEMPLVSVKYLLSMLWYSTAFLWGSVLFFEQKYEIKNWHLLMSFTLLFAVGYTITSHSMEGFSLQSSYEIMQPFYKEHTAYATSIAILFVFFVLSYVYDKANRLKKMYWLVASMIVGFGIITIYTRGAWLGVLGALGVYVAVFLWERHKKIFIFFSGLAALMVVFFIQKSLTSNYDTSGNVTFEERLFSVLNTKTDLSNMERINRWVAAINMIKEEPILGFGPGTYAMQYAPYQQSGFRTLVSTNLGNLGTTHNEFLLAGSEMGLPGMLLILALYLVSIISALKGYFKNKHFSDRWLYLVPLCALITYYLHALVNNYLDQDKVAIPVFLCLAQIVALDVFHQQNVNSSFVNNQHPTKY